MVSIMIEHPKFKALVEYLKDLGSAVIAYSGGTDSTFLLAASKMALGNNLIAFTIDTPYIARWEIDEAIEICRELGIKHQIVRSEIISSIKNNPEDRCYLCKSHLFSSLKKKASELGIPWVLDGTNLDDTGDYRPGLKALKELKIKSPLLATGIGKELIRKFSRQLNLPTWDKPAYACLLTRIPYNTNITDEELERIEKAEEFMMKNNFRAVRVRSHGKVARIEIPKERIPELLQTDLSVRISNKFKEFGYHFVTVDLDGYRMGSFRRKED